MGWVGWHRQSGWGCWLVCDYFWPCYSEIERGDKKWKRERGRTWCLCTEDARDSGKMERALMVGKERGRGESRGGAGTNTVFLCIQFENSSGKLLAPHNNKEPGTVVPDLQS